MSDEYEYTHDGTPEGMSKAIHDCVDDMGVGTSFVELGRRIKGFNDPTGEHSLCSAGNVVLWLNLSKLAVGAMIQAMQKGTLVATPAHVLVYAYDGRGLNMPVVGKRIPKGGYKEPHWLPLVFCMPETERALKKEFAKRKEKKT